MLEWRVFDAFVRRFLALASPRVYVEFLGVNMLSYTKITQRRLCFRQLFYGSLMTFESMSVRDMCRAQILEK